jgi:hypothetical protein
VRLLHREGRRMTQGHTERLESALAGRCKVQRKLGEGGVRPGGERFVFVRGGGGRTGSTAITTNSLSVGGRP